jgi:hypothetical protein
VHFCKKIRYFIILIIGLAACKKSDDGTAYVPGAIIQPPVVAEQVFFDLSYGNDPLQKLDLYLPAARTRFHTPLLIVVH